MKRVIVDKGVLYKFRELKNSKESPETGGVLIGHVFKNYLVITSATFPNTLQKLFKFEFIREKSKNEKIILSTWKKSKGKDNYVGEWHTHPENFPKPSLEDINVIEEQFTANKQKGLILVLLIVGIKQIWVGLKKYGKKVECVDKIEI